MKRRLLVGEGDHRIDGFDVPTAAQLRATEPAIHLGGDGEVTGAVITQIRKNGARLLALAPMAFQLMTGIFEIAGFMRIELGLGPADFADKDVEVRRLFFVPDKSGKREFLDGHRIPPGGRIANGPGCRCFFRRPACLCIGF